MKNLTATERLARAMPYPVKRSLRHVAGHLPESVRLGPAFRRTRRLLQESRDWTPTRLARFQMQELARLLRHAYDHVPYYREVFDARRLTPDDIRSMEDLERLPFLDRDIVRARLPDLVARNYPRRRLKYVTTGGSTGAPLGFYCERAVSMAREWAFTYELWKRAGFRRGDRCVVLRGNRVHGADRGRFQEIDPIRGDLILSSYHMDRARLPDYIAEIRNYAPDFMQAYPSAALLMADFIREQKLARFPSLRGLLCASETLYPWQRERLEQAFGCRVYSWYGHTEQAALAGECEHGAGYHVQPEYGIVELVPARNATTDGPDAALEIVATGFGNYACPFIRYRTADLAAPAQASCACGRGYPLLQRIEGRRSDYAVDADGDLVPIGPVLFGIHDAKWAQIERIQLIETQPGSLTIQIVPAAGVPAVEAEAYVSELFAPRLGARFDLRIHAVEHIPTTPSGKHRFFVRATADNGTQERAS